MKKTHRINGKILDDLLNEKEMQQKALAYNMGVSSSAVSEWKKGKPISEKNLKKLSQELDVDMGYLTGDKSYKNFKDMMEKESNRLQVQKTAINNLLESFGYILGGVFACEVNGDILPPGYPETEVNYIYEITTPGNEKRYINYDALESLVNDFFVLLNTRLIHPDITTTWGIKL